MPNRTDANIVVLAGGVSSRMKASAAGSPAVGESIIRDAETKPKAMIRVGKDRRPFLDFLLENIAQAGYRRMVIVVGDRDDTIRNYYSRGPGAGQFPDLSISYAVQTIPSGRRKPAGTAEALLEALRTQPEWSKRKFTVCNSDNLYSATALGLLLDDAHRNAMVDYDRSALNFPAERIGQFAVVERTPEGFVKDLVEKPSPGEITQAADSAGRIGVSMNIFRFSYDEIVPLLKLISPHPVRQEKELPAAVRAMVSRDPHSMFAIPLSEHVPDLTSLSDLPDLISLLQERNARDPRGGSL